MKYYNGHLFPTTMKIIGVMTENFSLYYDLVKFLKERGTPFISLSFHDVIPANVGLVVTSSSELDKVRFEPKQGLSEKDDISLILDKALKTLEGKDKFRTLIIGIDPGKRPGIAVLGDGEVLKVYQLETPEDAAKIVKQLQRAYPDQAILIRIGHGAPTQRNRIINALFNLGWPMQLVDESHTTHKTVQPDIKAAIDIAMSTGLEIKSKLEVNPSAGEIRDVQRISRLESKGAITISKPLAKKVASGELTLEQAIEEQRSKGGS